MKICKCKIPRSYTLSGGSKICLGCKGEIREDDMTKVEEIRELIKKYKKNQEEWCEVNHSTSKLSYEERNKIMKPFKVVRMNLYKDFNKLGINIGCSDYGDCYCLDIEGLEAVLDAMEE